VNKTSNKFHDSEGKKTQNTITNSYNKVNNTKVIIPLDMFSTSLIIIKIKI